MIDDKERKKERKKKEMQWPIHRFSSSGQLHNKRPGNEFILSLSLLIFSTHNHSLTHTYTCPLTITGSSFCRSSMLPYLWLYHGPPFPPPMTGLNSVAYLFLQQQFNLNKVHHTNILVVCVSSNARPATPASKSSKSSASVHKACKEGFFLSMMVRMVDDASHITTSAQDCLLLLLEAAAVWCSCVSLMGYVGLCSQPFR